MITHYEVQYGISNPVAMSNRTADGTVLSLTLINLEEYETYSMRVRGYTFAGFGPNSIPVLNRTKQDRELT